MPALRRLIRTETARCVHDTPRARGLKATQMDEYIMNVAAADTDRDPPSGVEIRVFDPTETHRFEGCYNVFSELRDDETTVCAFNAESGGGDGGGGENGEVVDSDLVGYLFLDDPSLTYHVHLLEAGATFPGGYIHRVFVAPETRDRGVATAFVSQAVIVADERGTGTVHVFVARSNRSSQRTFESVSFQVTRTRVYHRVGPW